MEKGFARALGLFVLLPPWCFGRSSKALSPASLLLGGHRLPTATGALRHLTHTPFPPNSQAAPSQSADQAPLLPLTSESWDSSGLRPGPGRVPHRPDSTVHARGLIYGLHACAFQTPSFPSN